MNGAPDASTRPDSGPFGMFWIGPAGTLTALHHDLTNNFIAQVTGRKMFKLLPPSAPPPPLVAANTAGNGSRGR